MAHSDGHGRRAWAAGASASAALLAFVAGPTSAQTRAGTVITNVATLRHDNDAFPSNAVALTVAERLDVQLSRYPQGDRPGMVAVALVNGGNGEEAFAITAVVTAGGATLGVPMVVVGNGDPVPLVEGRTPPIAPGATVTLLLPVSAVSDGAMVSLSVRAVTGQGTPATPFPGAGDGGGDAVVGATGASATVAIPLAAEPSPTIEKTQAVIAPDGSASAVRGARITYTLVARFASATAAASIDDPLPAGTTYLPGSLVLDGTPLADGDHLAAGHVVVPLGATVAGAVRTLRFTVVIS